jgi:single-strand DNA-binding protein
MARGVNKVIVIGYLGKDPEIKYTTSGLAVCNFSVATSESYSSRNGEDQERTEWHRIQAWGRLAEACGKYLAKGRQVYVEGSIRTNSFEDRDGVKRYYTNIIAREVQFLSGLEAAINAGHVEEPEPNEEDIPF